MEIFQDFLVREFDHRRALTSLLKGSELEPEDAAAWLEAAMAGTLSDAVLAAVLVAIQAKRATGNEIAAMAQVLRHKCIPVEAPVGAIDTCGTGGGPATYNISTAVAIVASACGAIVAKHGNRAVTSSCGSADVLEALGVRLVSEPERLAEMLKAIGIAFIFAQNHHPSLKAVGPVRKELGVRTVFNVLGPLANPAGVRRQIVGVYEESLLSPVAEAMASLGCERGLVVHSSGGMDEISPADETYARIVEGDSIREVKLRMNDFGLSEVGFEAISSAGSPNGNAEMILTSITEPDSPVAVPVIAGTSAALWVADLVPDFKIGAERARDAIASGAARAKLDQLVEATNSNG